MRRIQKISIVGGTVGVLMAGGIAYAAWTSEGSGSGTATAGTAEQMTIVGTSSDLLYPTKTINLSVEVSNHDHYPLNLDSLTAGAITSDKGAACDVTKLHASSGTYGVDAANRIAEGGSITKTLTLGMDADASEGCKGAVFTVAYTASAHSVE